MPPSPLPPLPPHHEREAGECLHCPKLCRHACPVSTADGRETTTPWGKMSLLALVARGALPPTAAHAATWWACTGCLRCAEHCDLDNQVAAALLAGRASALQAGLAPDPVARWLKEAPTREGRLREAARELFGADAQLDAPRGYVPGCDMPLEEPALARVGLRVARRLLGGPVVPVGELGCGHRLLEAGDVAGFRLAARRLAERLAPLEEVVFEDPGCLYAMRVLAPRLGVELPPSARRWRHVVEVAEARGMPEAPWPGRPEGPVRYHDPCKLGRGLGVYEAPRRLLGRLLGRPPEEFARHREDAECAGGGGLLPLTMPEEAAAVAEARAEAHRRAGGGLVVTACPRAARQLRARGLRVALITEWLDEALASSSD